MVSHGEEDRWDEAFDALNPYSENGPDVEPLVAMLSRGKPVPAKIAKDLAKYLNGLTVRLIGYGFVIKKFPKYGPKQAKKFLHDLLLCWEIASDLERHGKLEAAVSAIGAKKGLSRAKLMKVWSQHQTGKRLVDEIYRLGRRTTLGEIKRLATKSKIYGKKRRLLSR